VRTILQWPIRPSRVVLVSLLFFGVVLASLFLFFMRPPTAALCGGAKQVPHPRPVVVLIEEDPWLDVVGSDMPRLAIYEDGTIIYRLVPANNLPRYNQAVLSQGEMKELFIKLHAPTAFRGLKGFYNIAPNVTDQPTVDLYLYVDGMERAISVYGFVSKDAPPPACTIMSGEAKPDPLPAQFKEAYSTLVSLSPKASQKWVPSELELIIWPSEHNKESTPWPTGWPTLSDPRTVKRKQVYSLYMPGTKLGEVQAFLKAMKGAVVLDGKEWAITMRYPFPGEQTWDKAFSEIVRWAQE